MTTTTARRAPKKKRRPEPREKKRKREAEGGDVGAIAIAGDEGGPEAPQPASNVLFFQLLSNDSLVSLRSASGAPASEAPREGEDAEARTKSEILRKKRKTMLLRSRKRARKEDPASRQDHPEGSTNAISYIYLETTFFEGNEHSPQTKISSTRKRDDAVRINQQQPSVPAPAVPSEEDLLMSAGGDEPGAFSSPPQLPLSSADKKRPRKRFTAMVLLSINQDDAVVRKVQDDWRKAKRGLNGRVNEGIQLAMDNNMLVYVAHELLNGEFALPDVCALYESQRPLREMFMLP